jgi:hypothetical protein
MRADNHLTAEEALKLYLMPEEAEAEQAHVDRCRECAEQLRLLIGRMREEASETRLQAQSMPEEFWLQQRRQIERLVDARQGKARETRRFFAGLLDLRVWAGAAAVLIFSITLLQWAPPRRAESGAGAASNLSEIDLRDEQLLWEINEEIERDHADSLRPLELLITLPENATGDATREGGDGAS